MAAQSKAWTVFALSKVGIVVWIPLKALMSVCLYSVLYCSVYVAALRLADPQSKESYRLCIGLRNWKSGQGPTYGCRAIDRMFLSTSESSVRARSAIIITQFHVIELPSANSLHECKFNRISRTNEFCFSVQYVLSLRIIFHEVQYTTVDPC
jgi:hypothetical protein